MKKEKLLKKAGQEVMEIKVVELKLRVGFMAPKGTPEEELIKFAGRSLVDQGEEFWVSCVQVKLDECRVLNDIDEE